MGDSDELAVTQGRAQGFSLIILEGGAIFESMRTKNAFKEG